MCLKVLAEDLHNAQLLAVQKAASTAPSDLKNLVAKVQPEALQPATSSQLSSHDTMVEASNLIVLLVLSLIPAVVTTVAALSLRTSTTEEPTCFSRQLFLWTSSIAMTCLVVLVSINSYNDPTKLDHEWWGWLWHAIGEHPMPAKLLALLSCTVGCMAGLSLMWSRYCNTGLLEVLGIAATTCKVEEYDSLPSNVWHDSEQASVLKETSAVTVFINFPHQEGVKYVHELFERSADRYPAMPCVKIAGMDEVYTYQEMEAMANRIAQALSKTKAVTEPDVTVCVFMLRGPLLLACYLGILKAGACCFFVDHVVPLDVLSHMLTDSNPSVVLTTPATILNHPQQYKRIQNEGVSAHIDAISSHADVSVHELGQSLLALLAF